MKVLRSTNKEFGEYEKSKNDTNDRKGLKKGGGSFHKPSHRQRGVCVVVHGQARMLADDKLSKAKNMCLKLNLKSCKKA
jgi:hypothetical protein